MNTGKLMLSALIIMLLVVVTAPSMASAADDQITPIYDIMLDSGTFNQPEPTHLRDNYYGVVYISDNHQVRLRVIEVSDVNGANVDDTNVDDIAISDGGTYDTANDHTADPTYPAIVNLENETGMTYIAYGGSNDYKSDNTGGGVFHKTLNVSSNGTVTRLANQRISQLSIAHKSPELYKINNESILISVTPHIGGSDIYYADVVNVNLDTGSTSTSNDVYYCLQGTYWDYNSFSAKVNNTCYTFVRNRYETRSCTNTSMSGGSNNNPNCDYHDSPSYFSEHAIRELDGAYHEELGMFVMTYLEDGQYPSIMLRDDSNNLLYNERIETVQMYNPRVTLTGNNSFLLTYSNGVDTKFKSYTIDPNINEPVLVDEDTPIISGDTARSAPMPTLEDGVITSYMGDSGHVLTSSVGTPPPQTPADTHVTIRDEMTQELYDLTNKNLTFYAHCEDNVDYTTDIADNDTNIPVTCDNYKSFEIKVEYELDDNTTDSFKRSYLRDLDTAPENAFELDVYLPNPYTHKYTMLDIGVDGIGDNYQDSKLYFFKNINGTKEQITAGELDITNSFRATLIDDERYYVWLETDGVMRYLDFYRAPSSSYYTDSTVINLYDIDFSADKTVTLNAIEYSVYTDDDTDVYYYTKSLGDDIDNIYEVEVDIYNGSVSSGDIIFNKTYDYNDEPTNIVSFGPIDLSDYENDTVSYNQHIIFDYDGQRVEKTNTGKLWVNNKISLPLMNEVDQDFMDWFILILLSVIAVYGTVHSANMLAFGILGLSAVFVMFGWFSVAISTVSFAIIVTLISYLAKSRSET